jgi:hypothetical protein
VDESIKPRQYSMQVYLAVMLYHIPSIINKQKGSVQSRSTFDKNGYQETFKRTLPFKNCNNIVSHFIDIDRFVLVNDSKGDEWCHYMSEELEQLIVTGGICFATVKIEGKVVGIISAQRFDNSGKITDMIFHYLLF